MSKSLIDFDSVLEPRQGGVQTKIQKNLSLHSADDDWATFDVATPKNATTMPSVSSTSSLEGPLQLPNSVSAPESSFPTVQTVKSLSFPQANHGGTCDPVIVSVSQQTVAEVTSSGRKALPEDIFTMSYRPVYASTWDWRANPQVNMGYGQYGMQYPVGSVNTAQSFSHPNSVNILNMSRGPTLAHASTFPSLASPDMGSMTLLSRAPSMGSVGSVLSSPQVLPSSTTNNQYMVQQYAVNMPHQVQNNNFPIGYQGDRGIATTESAYGLSSMDQDMASQNHVLGDGKSSLLKALSFGIVSIK